jgi:hypothetical protein
MLHCTANGPHPKSRSVASSARPTPLELEVPSGSRSTRPAIGSGGWQQSDNPSEVLPGRLVQRRIGSDQVADHIPRSNVERAFRRRSHRERDRALRTETDPLGSRFLTRPYAYSLSEHIDRNRFVSCLEFSITAKTVQVFQKSSWRLRGNTVAPAGGSQVCRRIPAISALAAGSSTITQNQAGL